MATATRSKRIVESSFLSLNVRNSAIYDTCGASAPTQNLKQKHACSWQTNLDPRALLLTKGEKSSGEP